MLDSYVRELRKCRNLVVQITSTINLLNAVTNKYNDLSNAILLNYTIDEEKAPINKQIDSSKQNISQISNHLKSVTIPKINNGIVHNFTNDILSDNLLYDVLSFSNTFFKTVSIININNAESIVVA